MIEMIERLNAPSKAELQRRLNETLRTNSYEILPNGRIYNRVLECTIPGTHVVKNLDNYWRIIFV